jgi:hypothetical protein
LRRHSKLSASFAIDWLDEDENELDALRSHDPGIGPAERKNLGEPRGAAAWSRRVAARSDLRLEEPDASRAAHFGDRRGVDTKAELAELATVDENSEAIVENVELHVRRLRALLEWIFCDDNLLIPDGPEA